MVSVMVSGVGKDSGFKACSSEQQVHQGKQLRPEHKVLANLRSSALQLKPLRKRSHQSYVCQWTPALPLGGSGSEIADKLFQEFGELAADIKEGWAKL